MDGNGRWALERGLSRAEGHRMGVEALRPLVESCLKNKIEVLSVFAFSSENWSRPEDEVDQLMTLFMNSIEREVDALVEQGVRLCFTGDRSRLVDPLKIAMSSVESIKLDTTRLTLNVMMNYGGRWDILQASRKIAQSTREGILSLDQITEEFFETQLATAALSAPDLLIRTGGELRISNFFLWQVAYSELYFSDVYWPDFTVDEFEKALQNYASRQRRYGKTSHQILETKDA